MNEWESGREERRQCCSISIQFELRIHALKTSVYSCASSAVTANRQEPTLVLSDFCGCLRTAAAEQSKQTLREFRVKFNFLHENTFFVLLECSQLSKLVSRICQCPMISKQSLLIEVWLLFSTGFLLKVLALGGDTTLKNLGEKQFLRIKGLYKAVSE